MHPEYQSRPAHGWFPKGQKTAIRTKSDSKRLNIQGAIDLEAFQFTFVEDEKINAATIERLWAVMHEWVNQNRHYATYNAFTTPIFGFFRETVDADQVAELKRAIILICGYWLAQGSPSQATEWVKVQENLHWDLDDLPKNCRIRTGNALSAIF